MTTTTTRKFPALPGNPVPLYLQEGRATLVKYEFSERRNLYYIKILGANGTGYTLKYKFRRKAEATALVDKINRTRRIDLRYWNRIVRPSVRYLQSRVGRPELWETLHKAGWVID
jgi:hypothetical protein